MLTNLLIALVVLILFLLAFMLFRTLTFARPLPPVEPAEEVAVEAETIAAHLAAALRCQTVTVPVPAPDPALFEPFLQLVKLLEATYPSVHAALERQFIAEHALLYTWKGSNPDLPPVVLMAHQDVVPVEAEALAEWEHPPFAGEIADGFVWGRGAQDNKMALVTLLESVEHLLGAGFQPERTIYLAFGHDEETGGFGSRDTAQWFSDHNIHPEVVLDEGMAVVEGLFPGVELPVALVGVAEKGYLTLELTVEAQPGHSSTPPRETAIGILSKAVAFVEASPLPTHLTAALMTFRGLGSALPFGLQFALANTWLFGGLVRGFLTGRAPTNALIRTTTAPTIFRSGVKENILPGKASARINFRLLPGDTIAEVCTHVRKAIDDPRVTFEPVQGFLSEASTFSRRDGPAFDSLALTIRRVFEGVPVAPMLVLGGTDARYYHAICDSVYRFSPLVFTNADLSRVHAYNERVSVEALGKMVQFYVTLIKDWGAG